MITFYTGEPVRPPLPLLRQQPRGRPVCTPRALPSGHLDDSSCKQRILSCPYFLEGDLLREHDSDVHLGCQRASGCRYPIPQ